MGNRTRNTRLPKLTYPNQTSTGVCIQINMEKKTYSTSKLI